MSVRRDTWSVLSEMEPDLMDVERWGTLLQALGTADGVPPESLYAIGNVLAHMGARLRVQFENALSATRENGR